MRYQQRASGWILAVLLLCCYVPTSLADTEEDAKQAMSKGSTLFGKKKYQEALESYQLALQLVPERSGPYREIAKCFQQLDKPEEALHYFTEYLRRRPDAPERAEFERAITQLQGKLPSANTTPLSVTSEPPGAAVYLVTGAGEPRGIGFAPLANVAVPSEVSGVRLLLASYPTTEQALDLSAKTPVSLNIPLRESPAPNDALDDPLPATVPVDRLPRQEGKRRGLLFASLSTGGVALAAGAVFFVEKNNFQEIPADDLDLLNKKRAQLFVEAGVADVMGVTSLALGALWLLRRNKAEAVVITPQGLQWIGSF